ncbi:FAD-binding protein [Erwiniaceae bacterium BAC15a-03b]|uniref:FAD-binding protein n=1 Tax=Winslowiella arboricola TaxID=2978220 RepID=A0A9J6PNM6_9GAMM|nr:D-arabinono-1,4-lactone oxidase [Winslowiella arboricola]MCU5772488.1 FAD-binding protein [Winslowiella arboricola]MCU5779010.1 FAD-binding protein [Winslowiella arboricola]
MKAEDEQFPLRQTQSVQGDTQLWNWAQNAPLGARQNLYMPASEAELQQRVASHNGKIRVIGSRLAPGRMLNISDDRDLLLDLSQLSGLLAQSDNSVTFAAATPLHEVYQTLTRMGRMLASSPGVIDIQTLAGAMATGTHGQGLQQSSLADEALSIRMVLADGTIREFDRQHPWFGAAQVALGALGVVTAVTLKTIPSQIYTCFKNAVSASTLESDLYDWNQNYALSKAWWFVDDDQMHVWCARTATADEQQTYQLNLGELVKQPDSDSSLNNTIEQTLEHMHNDTQIRGEGGKQFKTVTRFKDFSDVTGDIYQVFCRGIAVPQINVEIGIPLARAAEVISRIKSWYARHHPHMHYPIILRCTGPSTAWLSPAYQQATCFFGFVVYYADDGTLSEEGCHFLREVEKLLAQAGGRPHWGKYYHQPLYQWQQVYPQWNAFRDVRRQLDPSGKFSNHYLAQLFD